MTRIERLQTTGIRRLGSKESGFRYMTADGSAPSAGDRARIQRLRIPPAWQSVAVAPSPRDSVQAVGRDAAGRWQYLYHAARVAQRERRKRERLLAFGQALPRMRRAVQRDLRRAGMPREKVLACALRILSSCFLRPGSRRYTRENGSFGLATLRKRHVRLDGDVVRLDFRGKSGKRQRHELLDARSARIVRELLRHPGEVFKYRDESGDWVDVRRRHINEYIQEIMGERFSAKDFRTWAATLICAGALAGVGLEAAEDPRARRREVVRAIGETARRLGNTPAVCRASYICPSVLSEFEKGRVIARCFQSIEELIDRRSPGLHPAEGSLLRLLKKSP